MGFIESIKRIIQGLKNSKENDFMSEEEIVENEQTEYESTEDEELSNGDI
jgi:hypothetical protein